MATEEMYEDDEFFINLTIDDTEFDEVEVKVTDSSRLIYQQINSIIEAFDLPRQKDSMCIKYDLARYVDGGLSIMDVRSTFLDYGINSYENFICIGTPTPNSSIKVTNHSLTTKQLVIEEMKRNGYTLQRNVRGDEYFHPLFFKSMNDNGPTLVYAVLSTNPLSFGGKMCDEQIKGIFKPISSYNIKANKFYVLDSYHPYFEGNFSFINWIKRILLSKV